MWWRVPRGGKLWEESKGDKNKRAFRRLMKAGRVFGCLAFVGDEPVGWCCVGPREDFPRLERTRALASEWNSRTWGVTCFFIKPGWRKRGVAGALLAESIKVARSNGAVEIEAYPVRPKAETDIPAAFAWTGIPALFETHGFTCKAPRGQTRDVYVLSLRRRTGHRSPKR
jgi:GNAT superfamily N-acetyltransferase